MKVLLQVAAVFALLSLGVGTAVLSYDSHHFAVDADRTLRDLDAAVKVQSVNLSAVQVHLDSVLSHVDATVSQLDLAAAEQRAYWQKTSSDSDKTVKALRLAVDRASLLLDHTDKQLNSSLLPDIDREFILTTQQTQRSIGSIGQAGDALTLQLNDPAIAEMAEHLNEAATNAAAASKSVADGTAHLDKATADIEQEVHRLTRPPSMAKRIGTTLLDIGAKLGSIFAGFVR